ncbi:PrpR N-terminal domain-containing protein [Globicatella sulfidifaciens]
MKKIKLLGIAPYEELNQSMKIVSQEYPNIESTIFTADLNEGQTLAIQYANDNYDVIISRGGTAKLIKSSVDLPVVDVSLSIYDVLRAIRLAENYSQNFAIVAYPSITAQVHLLCNLLGYKIEIHTINDENKTEDILDELIEKKYELILCDVITNRIALQKSMNTILITSGTESVNNAFQDAINIVDQLNRIKEKNSIIEHGILNSSNKVIILDQEYQLIFSNLQNNLIRETIGTIKLNNNKESITYYSKENKHYHTLLKNKFLLDNITYYSYDVIINSTVPVQNKFEITYQRKTIIENKVNKQMLFTKFIPNSIKEEIEQFKDSYNSFIIYGEKGTAKKNVAELLYIKQKNHNNYLISINCKLIDDKMFKYLVNATNGPFVEHGNTILFENTDLLNEKEIDKLITLIKMTNVLNNNTIVFTFNIHSDLQQKSFNLIPSQLNSAKLYTPSLRERKNELNMMTTLLLNKFNIEHNKDIIGFEPNALTSFLSYEWPGNFNQLQQGIKILLMGATTHYISEHQVMEFINNERVLQNITTTEQGKNLGKTKMTLNDYIKEIIEDVLEQNEGNQTKSAEQLGISRTTLWRYLKN